MESEQKEKKIKCENGNFQSELASGLKPSAYLKHETPNSIVICPKMNAHDCYVTDL